VADRTRTIVYEVHYDLPLDEVWPVLTDTERLNQVSGSGFAPYVAEEVLQPDGRVIRHARKRLGFFTWRWWEGLGEWVEGRFMTHERAFENGPFKELDLVASFAATATGTMVTMRFFASWASLLGDALAAVGFLGHATGRVVKGLDRLMADHLVEKEEAETAPVFAREARTRKAQQQLAAAVTRLESGPYAHGLAKRLADHLAATNELDLRLLRPLALARQWGVPSEQVVELFVAAHKAGLLGMRWEIMCPRCRGGKSKSVLLSDMPRVVHCDSCNIEYERDFANNVELVFSPSQWLRHLPEGSFCLMSPATTRHVKAQCDIQPGKTRVEAAVLADGHYRVCTHEAGGEREVELFGGAVPEITITADDVLLGDPGPAGALRMVNRDTRPRCVVIESSVWGEHALTGSRVISSAAFRDLCPEHLLRAGDSVEIDRVAILFSDLKGSTALYEAIGDSRAYALVRDHFAFLEERIRRHGGTVVKTIGDAVMASFADTEAAMAAAFDIQDEIAQFNAERGELAIALKIGLHEGQCIAVTTGDYLDYFGSAVNMAARLQSEAQGGEVVLSQAIAALPFAEAAVASRKATWKRARLAGFTDAVPFLAVSAG
jgi:class 3 adenylate cyclase